MEFRTFLALFQHRRDLILIILGSALILGLLAYRLQGQWYQGEVLLSVTPPGSRSDPGLSL